MRRIAIINQKGGVGKTTTTANLGAALARAGLRVLLIDLDPQGHLTLHFGVEMGDDQVTIYDVLTASTPLAEALVRPRERIALVPADIDLAAAESELVSVTGREVILREAVDSLAEPFDVVVIDCPPSLGVLTINALAASREVVIPLQAHFFGLQGLSKLLDTVMLVRQRINPALTISGIALSMHEAATRLAGEVADDLAKFLESARGTDNPWANAKLYKTCIRRNIKLAESSSFGQTVFDYAPKSNGAVDYADLAAEIFPGVTFADASGQIDPNESTSKPAVAAADPDEAPATVGQSGPDRAMPGGSAGKRTPPAPKPAVPRAALPVPVESADSVPNLPPPPRRPQPNPGIKKATPPVAAGVKQVSSSDTVETKRAMRPAEKEVVRTATAGEVETNQSNPAGKSGTKRTMPAADFEVRRPSAPGDNGLQKPSPATSAKQKSGELAAASVAVAEKS